MIQSDRRQFVTFNLSETISLVDWDVFESIGGIVQNSEDANRRFEVAWK